MRGRSHIAARAGESVNALKAEINTEMISTSPIKLSCVIARTQIPEAVRAVHAAFELERAPEEEA